MTTFKLVILVFLMGLCGSVVADKAQTTTGSKQENLLLASSVNAVNPGTAPAQNASHIRELGVFDSTILAARNLLGSIPESLSLIMIIAGLFLIWQSYKQEKSKSGS